MADSLHRVVTIKSRGIDQDKCQLRSALGSLSPLASLQGILIPGARPNLLRPYYSESFSYFLQSHRFKF